MLVILSKIYNRTDLKFERRPRSFKEDPQIPRLIALPWCYSVSGMCFILNVCKFRFELSLGKLRRGPATRWFDESFAPILRSGGNDLHVSSAQHKLPSSFHLTLPCPSIVHHLSGLNKNVLLLFYSYKQVISM